MQEYADHLNSLFPPVEKHDPINHPRYCYPPGEWDKTQKRQKKKRYNLNVNHHHYSLGNEYPLHVLDKIQKKRKETQKKKRRKQEKKAKTYLLKPAKSGNYIENRENNPRFLPS